VHSCQGDHKNYIPARWKETSRRVFPLLPRAATRAFSSHPLHPRPYYDHEAPPEGHGVIVRAGAAVVER